MRVKALLVSSLAILVILGSCSHADNKFTYEIVKPSLNSGDTIRMCVGLDGYEHDIFLVNEDQSCKPEGIQTGLCLSDAFTEQLLHYIKELEIRVDACSN